MNGIRFAVRLTGLLFTKATLAKLWGSLCIDSIFADCSSHYVGV